MDEWLWTTRGDGSGGEWPPHVLPSGSAGNQININFSQFSQPFARQENQMCNTADAQDSRNLSTLNLGHSEPSKVEVNNSFLAFLSGPYHHLKGGPFQPSKTEVNDSFIASPSEPSHQLNSGSLQVPYPMQEVSSISPVSGFGIMANSLGSGIHVTHLHAADMMDYNGHLMKTELEVPFSASVQHSRPLFGQSFVSPESIEAVQPVLYPYNSCKQGVHDTFQGNATTTAVSSFVQGHNTGYFHSSTDRCSHPRTQIKPMMTSEIKSTTFDHMSAHKFVAPRVFCMGTVGEIFLKENGSFGVICFCHNLRMSVAKFCEHCGSSLVNPAEAIHLENGQTIAEWRRLFFSSSGIRVADDNAGWDWTEGTIMANSFAGSWSSNLALPKPRESSRQLEFSGGFVGPGNHMKSSTLAVRTHLRQPLPRNLLSGTCANVLKKNATPKESSPSKRCSGSLLQPSNSWMMQEANDGHCYNGSKFPLNNGKQIAGYQFLSHEVKSNAINRNPLSQATCGISRNSLSNRMPITSSNVELSLRQPCQQSGRFIDTTAHVQRHHLEKLFSEKQNPYEHVPPRSSVPSIKEKIQQNLPYGHCETINSRRTILQHGNPSAIKKTETGCSGDEMNKSSSISLFLSHLNTFEGHAPPPINENFLTGKERCVSKLLNSDYYYEGSDTNMFKEMIHGAEKSSEMNENDNSQVIDGGKGIVYSDPDCSYTLLKPEACQGKMMLEPKVHYEAIDERFLQNSSEGTDMAQHRTVLIADTDERNLNGLSKNTENYNGQEYDLLRPMDLLPSSSSRAGFGPERDPSLGFLNSSSKSPLLPIKQTINAPHHLLSSDHRNDRHDESIQFRSQKQMTDMCLRNHDHTGRENISPNRNDKQVIPCCPLTIEMQRNSLKQDLMPQEEGRQCYSLPQEEGRQCYSCLQQGSSKATEHPLLSCHICHSTGHPYSPGNTVLSKSYYDTASTSRMPLCSGGHSIQHKYCHVNRTAGPLLLRLGNTEGTCACSNQIGFSNLEVPNSAYGKCRFHGINVKRHVDNRYGNCRHSVLSDCSLGCCCYVGHSGGFMDHIAYDSLQMIHSPNFSRDCIKHDVAPCGFEGCKKEFLSDNKDHSTVWREVPGNMKQNSFVDTLEKPRNKFQNAGAVEEQDRDAATSFSNQACPEAEIKENEMSHVCSGCSVPSLTEVSVQVNRSDSHNLGISKGKVVQDPVDEGSGIEKCGSSDMTLDSKTGSRKQSYGTPFQSSDGHTNTFNSKCSSKSVNFPCRLQARPSWRAEKGKTISSRLKKLDASKLDSVPSLIHDDLPNSIDQPEQQLSSSEEELLVRPGNVVDNASSVASKASGFKRKRSSVSYGEVFSHERCTDNRKIFNCGHPQLRVDYCGKFNQLTKKFNKVFSADQDISRVKGDNDHKRDKKRPKFISLKDMKMFSLNESEQFIKRLKPVVLGNSGIIGNGDCSYSRPAKIVSLRSILKNTARSTSLGIEQEFCLTTGSLSKESCKSTIMNAKVPFLEKNFEKEVSVRSERMDQECFNTRGSMEEPPVPNVEKACGSPKSSKLHIHHQPSRSKNKPGLKEARKRSLDELIGKANFSSDNAFEGKIQTPKCEFCRSDGKGSARNLFQISTRKYSCKACRCQLSLSNSDPFCCVCGSSNKDDNNHLIECSKCSIKVHQACYGTLRVPKGRWCCRPCRNNSKNTVCVLCGYEGGAMTRAVKSEAIVRSLFKAWKVEAVSKPMKLVPSSDVYEKCNSVDKPPLSNEHLSDSVNTEVQFESSSRRSIDALNVTTAMEKNGSNTLCGVQNSITCGVTDPSVTQWVHMVCGLWTPGTRCLNVDTMSTFDVSGASISRKNTVCVMCNRPGGSCIKCRLLSCSAHFHPWCAHQKGLLQSEIEGIDNENVGFYGRCSLHAFHQSFHAVNHSNEDEILRKKEFSCARVEEYKSRKKESAFLNSIGSNERGEWVVPQEQLNAWIYINGQKFCARELVKLPSTEAEADSQKEYARYRQTKGWKQLVVYKSRIHALGLYTSLFIPHGSMVVEYVGEIVGVRVADKREIEYQSGNKLQYKSACYFFRIDKDNIIDATCKGGIARFVNHSCLPNCVAKVISVANEKKVVFFAERDIYPGEEITYDYNFNHEDEGKKIACFCNSKNCRRYLN